MPRTGRPTPDPFLSDRERMVTSQVEARGVHDLRVLAALRAVPRHRFVPPEARAEAYQDRALPIGHEQTISQPYVVALMTELARLRPTSRVLEIGTGCGYQSAVLAQLAQEVCSIEFIEPLARRAAELLAELGYHNVQIRTGDGYAGWPEEAPFDAVLITAAPKRVPEPLLEQLKVGGRLIVPEGDTTQILRIYVRTEDGWTTEDLMPVRFVPMVGQGGHLEGDR